MEADIVEVSKITNTDNEMRLVLSLKSLEELQAVWVLVGCMDIAEEQDTLLTEVEFKLQSLTLSSYPGSSSIPRKPQS